MHTAGKVLLIIGGVITALGIVMIIGGASAASFDPTKENVASGTSGSFSAADSGLGFSVWVSESVACEEVSVSVMYDGEEQYYNDCDWSEPNEDDGVEDYYSIGSVGWFNDDGGTYTFTSSHTIYITDSGEELGEAVGGFFAAAGGVLIAICGGVILLIGLILALTLKTKDPVMMQQGQMMGGQMMAGQMPMQQMPAQQMQMPAQQMPAQQMPAQTTAQPYEYEQK